MADSAFSMSSESEREALPRERKPSSVLPWLALALVMLLIVLTRSWWRGAAEPRGERHPAVGRQVTRFDLKPLTGDGRELEAANLLGKVTLVNFWGPWCPACVIEFPHLVEIEAHFRGHEKFQFVSVSTNADVSDETGLAQSTAEFLKRHDASFPTYRDPRGATTRAIAAELGLEDFGYPTTLVIGPQKDVRAVWSGYAPGDEKAIQRTIEKALRDQHSKSKSDPAAKDASNATS